MQIDALNIDPARDNHDNLFDNKSLSPERSKNNNINTNTASLENLLKVPSKGFPVFFMSNDNEVDTKITQQQDTSSTSPSKEPASCPRDPSTAPSTSSSQRDASPHPRIPSEHHAALLLAAAANSPDNKEASLHQQQQQEAAASTTTVIDNRQLLEANNNSRNTKLPKFFTSAFDSLSWALDLIHHYPITSLCTVAVISRIAYRLRLFGVNYIHNCLPWVRFGSEVAATGGWVKLAYQTRHQYDSYLFSSSSSSTAYHHNIVSVARNIKNSLPQSLVRWAENASAVVCQNIFKPLITFVTCFGGGFTSYQNNANNGNNNYQQVVFDDENSPFRDQIRAASASLSAGERRQLRLLYIPQMQNKEKKKQCENSTNSANDEKKNSSLSPAERDRLRQLQRQEQAKIDIAKVDLIEKFKALPLEWRKQISDITEKHWEIYALSLYVIPQWDEDLMNQLREAILFRPCSSDSGWKLKLFADETLATRESSVVGVHHSTNTNTAADGSSTFIDSEESTRSVSPVNVFNKDNNDDDLPSAAPLLDDDDDVSPIRQKKIIQGGIRFIDTRLEAPYPYHYDNQFTIESIRCEALRRLQQQPNRRRQLVELIQELGVPVPHHENNNNNNDTPFNNLAGTQRESTANNNTNIIDANTTILVTSPNDDGHEQYYHHHDAHDGMIMSDHHHFLTSNNTHHGAASRLPSSHHRGPTPAPTTILQSDQVFEQLQTAAAESPQRLRSEFMKRASSVVPTPRTRNADGGSASPSRYQYLFENNGSNNNDHVALFGSGALPPTAISPGNHDQNDDVLLMMNNCNNKNNNNILISRPTEFDLTSPTRRQIEESLEESQTMQSVDNLLQKFLTPLKQEQESSFSTAAAAAATQNAHHQTNNTAVDLFSQALSENETLHNNNRAPTVKNADEDQHDCEGDNDGGDFAAPSATPRNDDFVKKQQPSSSSKLPSAAAAAAGGSSALKRTPSGRAVFSSSGKVMMAPTPRANK